MASTLAVAVLTRNSERTFERCLSSIADVADRCYVLDTGSEDKTVSIAQRFGCEVRHLEWPGRFDMAINALFDLVQEDWTLRLDSDEWLLPGAGVRIKSVIDTAPVDLFYLTRVDEHPDGSISEMLLPRLTRTECGLRVQGRIHEHFDPEGLKELRVAELAAKVGHDGFAAANPQEKWRRNSALLREELAERPDSLYFGIELGRTLMQLGEAEGREVVNSIADRLLTMQNRDEMPDPLCGDLLASALDIVPDAELHTGRTDALVRLARGWGSRVPGCTWAAAQVQLRRNRLRDAFDCLSDLEHMFVADDYWRIGGFHRGTIEKATWQNLALVAHQLGKRDIAKRNYERWLRLEPLNETAKQHLAALASQ